MRWISIPIGALLAMVAISGTLFVQADQAVAAPGDPVATLSVPSTIIEGTGGTTFLTAEVTLDAAPTESVSVTLTTADGSASSVGDSDFQQQTVSITFLTGAVGPATVLIPITADAVEESDETLSVSLTSGVGVELGGTPATATIVDDDGPLVASLSVLSTVIEGTGGARTLEAQVFLSQPSAESLSFMVTTVDGSASSVGASDFLAQSVSITFLAGALGPATVLIPITTDDVDESNETFTVTLTSPDVEVAGAPATVTIQDDDDPLVATLTVLSVVEGTGGTNLLQAEVTLSRPSLGSVAVTLTTADGSASSVGAADFVAQNVSITFLAGALGPATVLIPITTDDVDESDETFTVSLTSPDVEVAGSPATVTIQDDDDPLVATLSAAPTIVEGTGGTNFLQAEVTLSRTSTVSLSFTLTTADGSASSVGDSDFQAQSVAITFLAGALGPATILVPITTDSISELNETFVTSLTTTSPGVTVAGSPVTTTIVDDDDSTKPTVTIEQGSGQADPTTSTSITFTATFDEPVVGFGAADVTLSGTAGATTATVTGGPLVYTVSVSGMTQPGTVIATIDAGVVADSHGNTNEASTSVDNVVTFAVAGGLAKTGSALAAEPLVGMALLALGLTFVIARRARRQDRAA
jgi:hypothetical protein